MYYPYTAGVATLSHFYFNPLYLYKIYQNKENGELKLILSNHILGENASGFNGISDHKIEFKLKNIREIKKYLNKKKALLN